MFMEELKAVHTLFREYNYGNSLNKIKKIEKKGDFL